MKRLILVLPLLLALAGCGGGGGTTLLPTGNITRQLQPGDMINYAVSGRLTATDGTHNVSGTATMTTYSDTWEPIYGTRTFKIVTDMRLTGPAGIANIVFNAYVEQDAKGNIYAVATEGNGIKDTLLSANKPPIWYPGYCEVGTQYTHDSTWSISGSQSVAGIVVAQEGAAGYNAYKIRETITGSDTSVGYDWYVPTLGYSVKSELSMTTDDGNWDFTLTMTSKNF